MEKIEGGSTSRKGERGWEWKKDQPGVINDAMMKREINTKQSALKSPSKLSVLLLLNI